MIGRVPKRSIQMALALLCLFLLVSCSVQPPSGTYKARISPGLTDELKFSPDGTFTQTLTSGTTVLRRHKGVWTVVDSWVNPAWCLSTVKDYPHNDKEVYLGCTPDYSEIALTDELRRPTLVFKKVFPGEK